MTANSITLNLNPKLYSKEIIFSAAYSMFERAYFIFSGDPEKDITLEIFPKSATLESIKLDFYEELNNQVAYYIRINNNKDIVRAIVARALYSANPHNPNQEKFTNKNKNTTGKETVKQQPPNLVQS